MKRLFLSFVVMLAALGVQAQVIQNNSLWFDGSVLYTAHVTGNVVRMEGVARDGGGYKFQLTRLAQKNGEYVLSADDYGASRLRAEVGWRVQYIRNAGMNFLAVRDPQSIIVATLTLTPDDLQDCLGQEEYAEKQPIGQMLSIFLMNTTYVSRFNTNQLASMRKTLKLKQKRSLIEDVNLNLIISEMQRQEEASEGAPSGDVVMVDNELDFISALAPNKTVILREGTHLNLTPLLNDEEVFQRYGRAFVTLTEEAHANGAPTVVSNFVSDGRELTLLNINNLTIRGEKDCSIVVEPRYAYVLNFEGCNNIRVECLTLGHTEGGYCDGGVIGVTNAMDVTIESCDMYGCGTYGVVTHNVTGFNVFRSIIRDCTYGIMELYDSRRITFAFCDLYRNKEYGLVGITSSCSDVTFRDCRFAQNEGTLFTVGCDVNIENCEIHHAGEIGNTEQLHFKEGIPTYYRDKGPLRERAIGPKHAIQ